MSETLVLGRVLSFHRRPEGVGDEAAFAYHEAGAVHVNDGRIVAVGEAEALRAGAKSAMIVDHEEHLILPGFIDTHLHFPQVQVLASWGKDLLDWLNRYTFVEEQRFADLAHCEAMAQGFYDGLLNNGTTTGVAYGSVHATSAEAMFSEAERRGMCMIGGKVMMDCHAPDALLDTAQRGYDESLALIGRWHGKGRLHYAITPRFALTSTPAQLEAAGALCAKHPECYMQTHVSENLREIERAKELYEDAPDYVGIYERYGLLSERALLGHAIHLEPREIDVIADTGAKPVFCPTSNLFLGSGLYDDAGLRARGIHGAIATDIGGGTSYSMLQTLNEGYKVLQLRGQQMHPYAAFDWITRGNAEALGLTHEIGTLEVGTAADMVVLDARATPEMALRADRIETLAEELFLLMIMGDDRAIAQTYVGGAAQKSG
ncbi:guanine deaminase [Lentibacter sp. XHP0401]|uniref:guanine deaminase n=1 Tax=Lentibacter sp. XHP0401 TaxID=2984334 RepID=UPI0021E80AE0|nr:guanine deaminase [Lentibacter sp. XHP0401]MCV2893586.1 guanine deaminase [Lentibacter sp. XHP0401]